MKLPISIKIVLALILVFAAHIALSKIENAYRDRQFAHLEDACNSGEDKSCLKLADIYLQGRDGNIAYPLEVDTSPFKVIGYLASSCQIGNATSCETAARIIDDKTILFNADTFVKEACRLRGNTNCDV